MQLSSSALLLLSYLESIENTQCKPPDGCDINELVTQGYVSKSEAGCALTPDGHARLGTLRAIQRGDLMPGPPNA